MPQWEVEALLEEGRLRAARDRDGGDVNLMVKRPKPMVPNMDPNQLDEATLRMQALQAQNRRRREARAAADREQDIMEDEEDSQRFGQW